MRRPAALLTVVLIILGAAMFFALLMVFRSGGMPRIMFMVVAIAVGYLIYETIREFKTR